MNNIFRGIRVSKNEAIKGITGIEEIIQEDLLKRIITPEIVIDAADKLTKMLNKDDMIFMLHSMGMKDLMATEMVEHTLYELSKSNLICKIERELKEKPFELNKVQDGLFERYEPLGVLTHISAGNVIGLPAMSVIEGLLTGNINLLKLPSNDGGLSVELLSMLTDIEPLLKPYIYVFDLSSRDTDEISKLISVSNGVVVWGSDEAISGIRAITLLNIPIIEWGQKLSFSYMTPKGVSDKSLWGLAVDICSTEQLLCSSPQCLYYETASKDELLALAHRFSKIFEEVSSKYPPLDIDIHSQAEITSVIELAKMEGVLGQKHVLRDFNNHWSILVDYDSAVKPSPLFRNIWIKPIKREDIFSVFRPYRGYMQTTGLSCGKDEYENITNLFFKIGVNRITPLGKMSHGYPGQPHDGSYALSRYVRRISIMRETVL